MKIYSNNIHTDMDKLKSICKKYVIHPFFLTEDGYYRTNQQQYYKGEIKEGKHEKHTLNDTIYHTDSTFVKFNEMAYQLPYPHVLLEKHLFHFNHITVVLETKNKEIMEAYYESRKTKITDIHSDILALNEL